MNTNGTEGWAVGNVGEILHYQNNQWLKYPQSITEYTLKALWMNNEGTEGWACGYAGEILHYQNKQWQKHPQINTNNYLNAICMNTDVTEGWAVGSIGEIIHYQNKQWQKHVPQEQLTDKSINALWMNTDGTKGWAVGDDGIILKFSSKINNVILTYSLESLRELNGVYTLRSDIQLSDSPKIKLVYSQYIHHFNTGEYYLEKLKDTLYQFTFNQHELIGVLEGFKFKECYLELVLAYNLFQPPITACFKTKSFYAISPPKWHIYAYIVIVIICLIILLVILAIYFKYFRKIIFHPIGLNLFGFNIGKYSIADFFIHCSYLIRISLFREYRQNLKDMPCVYKWSKISYNPPHVHTEKSSNNGNETHYKKILETILMCSKKRLWLIEGQTKTGKTALLENWLKYTLELNETPFLIKLGSPRSPKEETASLMMQYGGFGITAEKAFNLLKLGGFVIFLDAFNEDRDPHETFEFVRQVIMKNHVIMTSQVDPNWDDFINISKIDIEPFRRE